VYLVPFIEHRLLVYPANLQPAVRELEPIIQVNPLLPASQCLPNPNSLWKARFWKDDLHLHVPGTVADFRFPQFTVTNKSIANIPVDVEGADLLYVALAGAHSIIPAAAVFNAAGENWTLSFFEAVNFGAFVGDPTKTKLILNRIVDEANRLKVKEVCICECGTAFRIMKQMSGSQPFEVSSITDVHERYIREGRIKLDKSKWNLPVTYHDPCQIARNGGVIDSPRYVLQHLTVDYRELSKDPRYNWCCGGGGGLVAMGDDTHDFRMKSAKVKSDQVKETGAKILATACENCHAQLSDLNKHYGMDVEVKFLSSMVADALVH